MGRQIGSTLPHVIQTARSKNIYRNFHHPTQANFPQQKNQPTNSNLEAKLTKSALLALKFGTQTAPALVDTGASCSIISRELYNKIKIQKGVIKEPPTKAATTVTTASSTPMQLNEIVKIHFKIQYLSWTFPFYIADNLPLKVILGVDFLKFTNSTINIAQQSITFPYTQPLVLTMGDTPSIDSKEQQIIGPRLGDNLNSQQKQQITKLLSSFPETVTKKIGRTNLIEYHINVKPGHSVRSRPYQFSPPKTEILRQHINDLLKDGIIRESNSPHSSPAFTVPKKGGKTRMVINYKALNNGLSLEATPTPTIESAFQHLGKAKWFTLLDLNSAYNQIPLDEQSKPLTAFVVPWAQYEFNFVPFGLANGSMVLTDLMNKVLGDVKFKYVYSFFDDLVIYSDTFEQHLHHIRDILNRLKRAGLTVNPSKMMVASNQIEFLGHVIRNNSLTISRERTKPIDEFPQPRTVKQLSRFLGMCSFFHKFIPDYSNLAAPLNKLKKKAEKFVWGKDQQLAFQKLKQALTSSPVLKMPNFDLPFILHTDASRNSLSAVISQQYGESLFPVIYGSRPTTVHEKNYSAFELEALAITHFLDKFRVYLEHRHFDLYTDSNALTWLLNHPRQVGKIARWITLINSFQFTVHHIKGKDNVVADCLSRMFEEPLPDNQAKPIITQQKVNVLFQIPEAFQDIGQHQSQDPQIQKIIKKLKGQNPPENYFLTNGILTHRQGNQTRHRVVIPERLIPLLFKYYHVAPTTAHLGVKKTWSRIEHKFWSPKLKQTITDMVKSCTACQRSKQAPNTKAGLLSSEIPTQPFHKVYIDHIGPLPRSKKGNKYILTIVDAFSKFAVFLPAKNTTAQTTVSLLRSGLFAYFGFPKFIVSDNVSTFKSKEFSDMCLQLGISHINTTPYYPNPSHAERVNKNIKIAIRIYHAENQTNWDQNIHLFQIAFNSAKHSSTGYSPADLFLSFQIRHPLELNWDLDQLIPQQQNQQSIQQKWTQAHQNLTKARQNREKQYNKDRHPSKFQVGDWVMYRLNHQSKAIDKINAKLLPLWSKPTIISAYTSPVTVLLMDPKTGKTIRKAHLSQLKRFFQPNSTFKTQTPNQPINNP